MWCVRQGVKLSVAEVSCCCCEELGVVRAGDVAYAMGKYKTFIAGGKVLGREYVASGVYRMLTIFEWVVFIGICEKRGMLTVGFPLLSRCTSNVRTHCMCFPDVFRGGEWQRA